MPANASTCQVPALLFTIEGETKTQRKLTGAAVLAYFNGKLKDAAVLEDFITNATVDDLGFSCADNRGEFHLVTPCD